MSSPSWGFEAVSALSAGRGAAIAVVGEPGLGKSRLLAEVRAASPVGVRWAEARGQAFGQTASYTVAVRLLEELTAPGELEAGAGAALRAAVASALPEPGAFRGCVPRTSHGSAVGP